MGQAGYRVVDRVTGHVRTKGVDIDIDIRVMSHGGGGGQERGGPTLSLSLTWRGHPHTVLDVLAAVEIQLPHGAVVVVLEGRAVVVLQDGQRQRG